MLALLLRKVSSKTKSLRKIRKSHEVRLHSDESKRFKNIRSNGIPLQLFKYEDGHLQNTACPILNARSSLVRISDKMKIAPNRQLNLLANYQNFQLTEKTVTPRDTGYYAHILCNNRPRQKILSGTSLFSCPTRNVYFKLIKRDSKGKRIPNSDHVQPEESENPRTENSEPRASYRACPREERSETPEYAHDQSAECDCQRDTRDTRDDHRYLMQKTEPSCADEQRHEEQPEQRQELEQRQKPEKRRKLEQRQRPEQRQELEQCQELEQRQKPEKRRKLEQRQRPEPVECKKSSEDSKDSEEPEPPVRERYPSHTPDTKLLEERVAANTRAKSKPTKVNKLISYMRRYGDNAIKKCKATKYMKLSKRRCDEIQHPDLSNVPQSPETRPDPPPPRSEHWSERKLKHRGKRRPPSKAKPMVYVPYESTKREKRDRDQEDRSSTRYVNNSTYKARDDARKFSSKTCMRRGSTPTSPHIKCVVSFKETDEKYAQLPPLCKRDKPFELDDVSDLKPNAASLKYRLSKCPAVLKSWEVCDCRKAEPKGKTVKLPKDSFLPPRKKWKCYKGSGEWMRQTYPYRLKVFRSKDCLDPRPPEVIEVKPGNRLSTEEVKQPKLSPVHRELAKMVNTSCPTKYCSDVDIAETKKRIMEARRKKEKKLKRFKSFSRSSS